MQTNIMISVCIIEALICNLIFNLSVILRNRGFLLLMTE